MKHTPITAQRTASAVLGALLAIPSNAWSHCDSLDGPVVADARAALEKGDVTPALKWVSAEDESQIREEFRLTLAVRTRGDDARALADRYFFETLVRIHRAGEGEAFTGLKRAGEVDSGIEAADRALASGSPDKLTAQLQAAASEGIRSRFAVASHGCPTSTMRPHRKVPNPYPRSDSSSAFQRSRNACTASP